MRSYSLVEAARRAAQQEIADEDFRTEVDRQKERIRRRVPLWHRLFPWQITITKRKSK